MTTNFQFRMNFQKSHKNTKKNIPKWENYEMSVSIFFYFFHIFSMHYPIERKKKQKLGPYYITTKSFLEVIF